MRSRTMACCGEPALIWPPDHHRGPMNEPRRRPPRSSPAPARLDAVEITPTVRKVEPLPMPVAAEQHHEGDDELVK